ncbi:MAG: STAS domain-containing protein [Phycisphaerales bacterium]|nr:STAS domain-containing protein [Phycisphaerales bacterium]
MKISAQEFEHIAVLTLSGEFTADDTDAFQRSTDERLRAGARHIVLDCQHLEFVDSKGLEAWINLQESLGDQGGQLRLISPDETVSTILKLTRLDLALESHESLERAVRSLR